MTGRSKSTVKLGDLAWLPSVAETAIAANNLVYGRHAIFPITIAGDHFECRPSTRFVDESGEDIPVTVGGWRANIRLAAATADHLLQRYCAAPNIGRLGSLQRRILLGLAFDEAFSAVEQAIGHTVLIAQSKAAVPELTIAIAALRPGFEGRAELSLPLDAMGALLPLARTSRSQFPAWTETIPTALRRCVGIQVLSLAELRNLSSGDVIMCDPAAATQQFALIEDHLFAPLDRDGTLTMPWRTIPKRWSQDMEPTDKQDQRASEDTLDDLPIRLVFELGRTELSLREVRELSQGAILPVAINAEDCVDIFANGRRVGRGSLLKIGSGLGVRIVHLVPHV